jgi:hypothetical protein
LSVIDAEVEKDPEAVTHKAVEVLGDLAKHGQISPFFSMPLDAAMLQPLY